MESTKIKECDEKDEDKLLSSLTDPMTQDIMEDPVKLNPCGHWLSFESAEMISNDTNICPHPNCGKVIKDFARDKTKAAQIKEYNKKQQDILEETQTQSSESSSDFEIKVTNFADGRIFKVSVNLQMTIIDLKKIISKYLGISRDKFRI